MTTPNQPTEPNQPSSVAERIVTQVISAASIAQRNGMATATAVEVAVKPYAERLEAADQQLAQQAQRIAELTAENAELVQWQMTSESHKVIEETGLVRQPTEGWVSAIRRIVEENARLRSRLNGCTMPLPNAQGLVDANERIGELEREVADLKLLPARNAWLTVQHAGMKAKLEQSQQALTAANERAERLLGSLTSTNAEFSGLERETEEYMIYMKKQDAKIAELTERAEKAEADYDSYRRQVENALGMEVDTRKPYSPGVSISNIQNQLTAAQAVVEGQIDFVAKARADAEKLRGEVARLENLESDYKQGQRYTVAKWTKLANSLGVQGTMFKEYGHANIEQAIASLQAQLEEAQATAERRGQRLTEMSFEVEKLRKEVASPENAFHTVRAKLDAKDAKLAALQAQLDAAKGLYLQARNEIWVAYKGTRHVPGTREEWDDETRRNLVDAALQSATAQSTHVEFAGQVYTEADTEELSKARIAESEIQHLKKQLEAAKGLLSKICEINRAGDYVHPSLYKKIDATLQSAPAAGQEQGEPSIAQELIESLEGFAAKLASDEPIEVTVLRREDTPDGPMHTREKRII